MFIMDAVPGAAPEAILSETSDYEQLGECDWSPDGARIAYYVLEYSAMSSSKSGVVRCDIYVMDALGGDSQLVFSDTQWIRGLDWSPDGTHIVFSSTRGGNYDIWVAPVSGGAPVQLTHDPADDTTPAWSPDGSRIAFASLRTGNSEVWLMTSTGEDPVQVTFGPGASGARPGPPMARESRSASATTTSETFGFCAGNEPCTAFMRFARPSCSHASPKRLSHSVPPARLRTRRGPLVKGVTMRRVLKGNLSIFILIVIVA